MVMGLSRWTLLASSIGASIPHALVSIKPPLDQGRVGALTVRYGTNTSQLYRYAGCCEHLADVSLPPSAIPDFYVPVGVSSGLQQPLLDWIVPVSRFDETTTSRISLSTTVKASQLGPKKDGVRNGSQNYDPVNTCVS